jgi:hypothetical protein
MSNVARKYISDYCKKNSITPTALEREAGIPRDAVYSFVIGKVADLKLNTAVSIAELLSITLDELVGREKFLKTYVDENSTIVPINSVILKQVTSFVFSYVEQNSLYKYNFNETLYAICEIYEYSVCNNRKAIDNTFAEYFCKNHIRSLR